MAVQTINYQCPACTGPLQFSPETGKPECEYCGSVYELAEIEALYQNDTQQWDTSELQDNWGEAAAGMKTYRCPSCTAELICDQSVAASCCPYCGSPTMVPGQFSGALKPDYVLPFKQDKDAAVAALKNHYQKRFFLPKDFCTENHIEEVQGVYVPFWLFDGKAEGSATFEGTRSRTYRRGDYQVTETSHYRVNRAGSLEFEKVPVDASNRMPDGHMDSIEPFDYGELQPFTTAYLPGFMADKYDVEAGDSRKRADDRCEATLVDELRKTVVGYETVSDRGSQIRLQRGKVHYALLPVWLLGTKWQGQDFLFAMNGQSGKLVGDLPVDKKKYWTTFFSIGIGLSILVALLIFLLGSPDNPMGSVLIGAAAAFLVSLLVCSILKAGMKNVRLGAEAQAYISGRLNLTWKRDQYTHTTTHRVKVQSSSGKKR